MPFRATINAPSPTHGEPSAQPLLDTLDVLSRRLVDVLPTGVAGDKGTDQMFDVRDRMDAILNGGKAPAGGPWSATEAPLTQSLLDALRAERDAATEACTLSQDRALAEERYGYTSQQSVDARAQAEAAHFSWGSARFVTDEALRVALGGAR